MKIDCVDILKLLELKKENNQSNNNNNDNFQSLNSLNPEMDVILLCSGGFFSVSALWKIIEMKRQPIILFIEGLVDEKIEQKQKRVLAKIVLEMRNENGKRLGTFTQKGYKSWVQSVFISGSEKNLKKMRLYSRYEMIDVILDFLFKDDHNCYQIIWGNSFKKEFSIFLKNTTKKLHFSCFENEAMSIQCFYDGERKSDKVRYDYRITPEEISPCELFPFRISNLVCGCSEVFSERRKLPESFPFLTYCFQCVDCLFFEKHFISWMQEKILNNKYCNFGTNQINESDYFFSIRNLSDAQVKNHESYLISLERIKTLWNRVKTKKLVISSKPRGRKKKVKPENETFNTFTSSSISNPPKFENESDIIENIHFMTDNNEEILDQFLRVNEDEDEENDDNENNDKTEKQEKKKNDSDSENDDNDSNEESNSDEKNQNEDEDANEIEQIDDADQDNDNWYEEEKNSPQLSDYESDNS